MNHQPPDWAYETPPTAFCPPPRAGSVPVAAGRAAVDGDEHGVPAPVLSPPDVTPNRPEHSPVEGAAPTPVTAPDSPEGESEPRVRRPASVRTFVKLSVLYLAVAAAVVVLFPPATTAADMTQRERSELFASGEMPGGVYQVGDGPFVAAGEASESSLQGGPVLLTVPGSVGTAPAVIFGRASDLSAEVTAKKGAEFTMVRSGGVEIPFVGSEFTGFRVRSPVTASRVGRCVRVGGSYCSGGSCCVVCCVRDGSLVAGRVGTCRTSRCVGGRSPGGWVCRVHWIVGGVSTRPR